MNYEQRQDRRLKYYYEKTNDYSDQNNWKETGETDAQRWKRKQE